MLPEATMEITAMAMRDVNADDKRLYVNFSMHPRLNTQKSADAGRPIFDDVEYVMIMVPGDANSIVHRPIMDIPGRSDLERFPMQYQAFKNRKDQDSAAGTPLSVCGFLTQGQIRELEFFHVKTVEHLANMPDSNANKFMGIQDLKRKAQDFLRVASDRAPLTAMRSELEHRDNQIAALQAQVAELLAAAQKPKRGKAAPQPEPESEAEAEAEE